MLKIGEVAEIVGVSRSTIRTWTDRGLIKAHLTPTGHRLYDEEEIEKCIAVKNGGNDEELIKGVYTYQKDIVTALRTSNEDRYILASIYAQQISHLIDKMGKNTKEVFLTLLSVEDIDNFRNVSLPLSDKDISYLDKLCSQTVVDFVQNLCGGI